MLEVKQTEHYCCKLCRTVFESELEAKECELSHFNYGLIADEIRFQYRPGKQHPDMHVRLARLNQTPVEAVFKLDRIVYDAVLDLEVDGDGLNQF